MAPARHCGEAPVPVLSRGLETCRSGAQGGVGKLRRIKLQPNGVALICAVHCRCAALRVLQRKVASKHSKVPVALDL